MGKEKEKKKKMERESGGSKKGEEKVKERALQIMDTFQVLPRLVVFDLDHTLWPFYCECRSNRVIPALFPEAKGIINALNERGIDIAIASCCSTAQVATSLLDKFGVLPFFTAQEILFSSDHKIGHFERIQRKSSIAFKSMLFFDDDPKNTNTVSKMGVTCTLVGKEGFNLESFQLGLTNFSSKFDSK